MFRLKIELATEEDKAYGIDQWARLFKAATWEELKALAAQNAVFEDVAKSMFMYSCDKDVLEQCRKVEDNQRFMAYQKNKIESLEASNADLKASNADLKASNAQKDSQLADKDNQLAQKDARIAYLEAQLNKNK